MSVVMYTNQDHTYFWAMEIGMPEAVVEIGEGDTPADAVAALQPTQYQSADFGCRGPSNSRAREIFSAMGPDDVGPIEDCTDDEEAEAAGDA